LHVGGRDCTVPAVRGVPHSTLSRASRRICRPHPLRCRSRSARRARCEAPPARSVRCGRSCSSRSPGSSQKQGHRRRAPGWGQGSGVRARIRVSRDAKGRENELALRWPLSAPERASGQLPQAAPCLRPPRRSAVGPLRAGTQATAGLVSTRVGTSSPSPHPHPHPHPTPTPPP
jgi:hypothetical protein